MPQLSWHDYLLGFSAIASIAGLALLLLVKPKNDDLDDADRMLLLMSFSYWLVFCAAFTSQKLLPPDWEIASLSVKLTAVIAYLLTATCILSLPLQRVANRQPE